jgi:hypothetical protein
VTPPLVPRLRKQADKFGFSPCGYASIACYTPLDPNLDALPNGVFRMPVASADRELRYLNVPARGLSRWKALAILARVTLQGLYAGARGWSEVTGPRPRATTLDRRCGQMSLFAPSAFCRSRNGKILGGRGGGLSFFAPKSFIGKHSIGHLQLCTFSVAKQGRWVYEGSELKAFRIPTKYFSINFIVLSCGSGCEYSVTPWWVGASYSV